ncbi:pentapeptide repeat-containing protein [Plectonema cf. radiosum LEGE 06105]|uniref:Pentapeptide repeat-containing protein n=1 Tax=Plectonema cf. radiosum LEGE 06105 TaxID=945769 RepID=A0A8J7JS59_9CYAN|nr:pentapeptide repeat-containing protein [Plectonema radiosum]MBE9212144.1 pentapeptide repeat-containing protein [Plectonema cf. radiosum LEGE 06105]
MSAKKTDALTNWLIGITIFFSVSPIVIFTAISKIEGLSNEEKIEYKSQALMTSTGFFLGLAIIINAYYGAKRTIIMEKSLLAAYKDNQINQQNIELKQQKLLAERFMSAITQLGHDSVATRTGAIYALERVAQESSQEYWTIMEILTAFVRENRITSFTKFKASTEVTKIPTDIQAALTVIGRRNANQDPENKRLNLRNAQIRGVDLSNANLQRADLRNADLSGACLQGTDLYRANLDGATISQSNLYQVNLQQASLKGANLAGSIINKGLLYGANLRDANLCGASLRAANLIGANLYKANLMGANLKAANLAGAKLFLANLQSAKLDKAKMYETGLIGANLQQANLSGADLRQANLNAAKLQQAEVYFANFSKASLREANFSGANLMGTDFQSCILYETNFSGANLTAANLSYTDCYDVNLEGTILKGAKNFQPQLHKMAIGEY